MKAIFNLALCTFFIFSNVAHAEMAAEIKSIDWPQLQNAFEAYANYPTGSNAQKVISLLPKKEHAQYTNQQQEHDTIEYIYNAYQFRMLERQVLSGDRDSVRLAFNLRAIADGAFAEDLDIMLGSLIRINPKLFLLELDEFQIFTEPIDALIGNLGDVYVDRAKAHCYEYQLRINSLSTVKEQRLNKVKDKCVNSLQDQIKRYCE